MSALTQDNRDMVTQEEYLLARIEALTAWAKLLQGRIQELEQANAELLRDNIEMQHNGHLGAVGGE